MLLPILLLLCILITSKASFQKLDLTTSPSQIGVVNISSHYEVTMQVTINSMPSSGAFENVFQIGNDADDRIAGIWVKNSRFLLRHYDNDYSYQAACGEFDGAFVLSTSTLYSVNFTFDGTEMNFYVDDQLYCTATDTNSDTVPTTRIRSNKNVFVGSQYGWDHVDVSVTDIIVKDFVLDDGFSTNPTASPTATPTSIYPLLISSNPISYKYVGDEGVNTSAGNIVANDLYFPSNYDWSFKWTHNIINAGGSFVIDLVNLITTEVYYTRMSVNSEGKPNIYFRANLDSDGFSDNTKSVIWSCASPDSIQQGVEYDVTIQYRPENMTLVIDDDVKCVSAPDSEGNVLPIDYNSLGPVTLYVSYSSATGQVDDSSTIKDIVITDYYNTFSPTTSPTQSPIPQPTSSPTKAPFPSPPTLPPDGSHITYLLESYYHELEGEVHSSLFVGSLSAVTTTCRTECDTLGDSCLGYTFFDSNGRCYFFRDIYGYRYDSGGDPFNYHSVIPIDFQKNKYQGEYEKHSSHLCDVNEYLTIQRLNPFFSLFVSKSNDFLKCQDICDAFTDCVGFETYWPDENANTLYDYFECRFVSKYNSNIKTSSSSENDCYVKKPLVEITSTSDVIFMGDNPDIDFDLILYSSHSDTFRTVLWVGDFDNNVYPRILVSSDDKLTAKVQSMFSTYECEASMALEIGKKYHIKIDIDNNERMWFSIDDVLMCTGYDSGNIFVPPFEPQDVWIGGQNTYPIVDGAVYNFEITSEQNGMRCEYARQGTISQPETFLNGNLYVSNQITNGQFTNCKEFCNSDQNCLAFTIYDGGTPSDPTDDRCSYYDDIGDGTTGVVSGFSAFSKTYESCYNVPTPPPSATPPTPAPSFPSKKVYGDICSDSRECGAGLWCDPGPSPDRCLDQCDSCECTNDGSEKCSDFRVCYGQSVNYIQEFCSLRKTTGFCVTDNHCDVGYYCRLNEDTSSGNYCSTSKQLVPSSAPSRSPTPLSPYQSGCGSNDYLCRSDTYCSSNQCIPYSSVSSCSGDVFDNFKCEYDKICIKDLPGSNRDCVSQSSRTEGEYCGTTESGSECADGFYCKETPDGVYPFQCTSIEWREAVPDPLQINEPCNPHVSLPVCDTGLDCLYYENVGHVCGVAPTNFPTRSPTGAPSFSPTTLSPTQAPTNYPTKSPTPPTKSPTSSPTKSPSVSPTRSPTITCFDHFPNEECESGLTLDTNIDTDGIISFTESWECEELCRNENSCKSFEVNAGANECRFYTETAPSPTPAPSDFSCHSKLLSCTPTLQPTNAPSGTPTGTPTAAPTSTPTAAPTLSLGSSCTLDQECGNNPALDLKYCDQFTNTCNTYSILGEACNATFGQECFFAFECVYSSQGQEIPLCENQKRSIGQTCKYDSDCSSFASCTQHEYLSSIKKCFGNSDYYSLNELCNPESSIGCASGLSCQQVSDDTRCQITLEPTSSPTTKVPTVSPSAPTFAPTNNPTSNAPTLSPTNPTPAPTKGFGQSCSADIECASSLHCNDDTNVCSSYLSTGADCNRERQCNPSDICALGQGQESGQKTCQIKRSYDEGCQTDEECCCGYNCLEVQGGLLDKRCLDSYVNTGGTCGNGVAPWCDPSIDFCNSFLGNYICSTIPTPSPTQFPTRSPTNLPTTSPTEYYLFQETVISTSTENKNIAFYDGKIVVGFPAENKVIVYQYNETLNTYVQQQEIQVNSGGFGSSVYVENGVLVIGAPKTGFVERLTDPPTPPTASPITAEPTSSPTPPTLILDAYEICESDCATLGNVKCAAGLYCNKKVPTSQWISSCPLDDQFTTTKVCTSLETYSGGWGTICKSDCLLEETPCRFGLECKETTFTDQPCGKIWRCKLS